MSVNTVFNQLLAFFSPHTERCIVRPQSAVVGLVRLAEVCICVFVYLCICVFDLVYRSAGVKIKVYWLTNQT